MACHSGIGTYIRSLLPRLAASSHRFRLLIHPDTLGQCPELASFDTILTKAPLFSIQEQMMLPLHIPRCDLFWSPHFNIPIGPIRARKRLVTIHDVYFLAHPQEFPLYKRAYAAYFIPAALRRSDRVITESTFSFQEILKHAGPYAHKMTMIHLGVDPDKYKNTSVVDLPQIPEKFLLYVGNLAPRKNICGLLQALDFLPADVHLVLVGKGDKWDDWKLEAAKRKEKVSVLGQVSHDALAQLYRRAALLVHPSQYEGFGLTPLEAMSADCPTVVSDAASLPEVCGDASVYVDPSDPASIARGINAVWSDPELQGTLRAKGRKRVEIFNWDISAQKHLEVIEKLL